MRQHCSQSMLKKVWRIITTERMAAEDNMPTVQIMTISSFVDIDLEKPVKIQRIVKQKPEVVNNHFENALFSVLHEMVLIC